MRAALLRIKMDGIKARCWLLAGGAPYVVHALACGPRSQCNPEVTQHAITRTTYGLFHLTVILLFLLVSPLTSFCEVIPLWVQPRLAVYDQAVSEVSEALKRVGLTPQLCEDTSLIPPGTGTAILIGAPTILKRLVEIGEPNLSHPESYLVRKIPGSRFVIATANGERGLLYAAQVLSERIAVYREFPEVFPQTGRPFLEVRAFGIEWPQDPKAAKDYDTEAFPARFTRHLVRNRFNMLVIQYRGQVRDLLEKTSSDSALTSRRLKGLIAQARLRCLEVSLWLNPDAALETPLPEKDSPSERRNRWATDVAELALAYPGVHLGLWPSDEQRERGSGDANQWYDGFLVPWQTLAPKDAFTFVSGQGFDPRVFETEIARNLAMPPLVALKWCGDHPEVCLEPQFIDQGWFQQQPQDYGILWVLADQDVRCLRSSFYHRTRQIITRMGQAVRAPGVAGFLFFPRGEEVGTETLNRESVENQIPWSWGFQKHWYRHALWGRLGYDPRQELKDFEPYFVDGYGPEVGPALIQEETAGEDILWRVSRFHWRYESADWYPEACLAPGEGGPYGILGNRTGPAYRDTGAWEHPFESILEFMFSLASDARELSILESVGYELAGVVRPLEPVRRWIPLETAEILRRQNARLEEIVQRLDRLAQNSLRQFEARHMAADLVLQRLLGSYYRSKILSARLLALALCQNSSDGRDTALKEMEKGLVAWRAFVERVDRIYKFPPGISGQIHAWSDLLAPAEKDLEIIKTHPAFTRTVRTQAVYGPFVKGSTELVEFERKYVRSGDQPPIPSATVEVSTFATSNVVEQGWLDILNHYAGFLPLGKIPNPASGEVVWVPYPIPSEVHDFLSLRLVGGTIDEVVWGGRTVLGSRPEEMEALSEKARLAGPEGVRTLWIRSDRPPMGDPNAPAPPQPPIPRTLFGDWGFAVAVEPDLPFLVEPAWWETDGLVVRVQNRLVQGRLDNVSFEAKPVGDGWWIPPSTPPPISLSEVRTFLMPCSLREGWAALRLESKWRREQVGLDFFPPPMGAHISLIPGSAGMIPRLWETPKGWGVSTALRGWQNALLYRVNESYLIENKPLTPRKMLVEWYPDGGPSGLGVEYQGDLDGEMRRNYSLEITGSDWVRTELSLPGLLEHPGNEGGVLLRLFRTDQVDLVVRNVGFE